MKDQMDERRNLKFQVIIQFKPKMELHFYEIHPYNDSINMLMFIFIQGLCKNHHLYKHSATCNWESK